MCWLVGCCGGRSWIEGGPRTLNTPCAAQMGRGRTTTGMIIATLLLLRQRSPKLQLLPRQQGAPPPLEGSRMPVPHVQAAAPACSRPAHSVWLAQQVRKTSQAAVRRGPAILVCAAGGAHHQPPQRWAPPGPGAEGGQVLPAPAPRLPLAVSCLTCSPAGWQLEGEHCLPALDCICLRSLPAQALLQYPLNCSLPCRVCLPGVRSACASGTCRTCTAAAAMATCSAACLHARHVHGRGEQACWRRCSWQVWRHPQPAARAGRRPGCQGRAGRGHRRQQRHAEPARGHRRCGRSPSLPALAGAPASQSLAQLLLSSCCSSWAAAAALCPTHSLHWRAPAAHFQAQELHGWASAQPAPLLGLPQSPSLVRRPARRLSRAADT